MLFDVMNVSVFCSKFPRLMNNERLRGRIFYPPVGNTMTLLSTSAITLQALQCLMFDQQQCVKLSLRTW